jgi:hypothetical protein
VERGRKVWREGKDDLSELHRLTFNAIVRCFILLGQHHSALLKSKVLLSSPFSLAIHPFS